LPDEPKRHWATLIEQGAAHPVAFAVVFVYSVLRIAFEIQNLRERARD
jgi:hypothetical protein